MESSVMAPARREPDTSTYRGRCAMRLKHLREAARLSVDDVAKACDVTVTTVYHWERSHSEPKLNMLPVLANLFGLKSPRSVLSDQ